MHNWIVEKECIKSAYTSITIRFLCLLFLEMELRCRFLMQTYPKNMIEISQHRISRMQFEADAQQQQITTFEISQFSSSLTMMFNEIEYNFNCVKRRN